MYLASATEHVGQPSDSNEAADVAWISVEQVADALNSGSITDAFTQLGVTLALAKCGYGHLLMDSTAQSSEP